MLARPDRDGLSWLTRGEIRRLLASMLVPVHASEHVISWSFSDGSTKSDPAPATTS